VLQCKRTDRVVKAQHAEGSESQLGNVVNDICGELSKTRAKRHHDRLRLFARLQKISFGSIP
jgi:hypothetical protein